MQAWGQTHSRPDVRLVVFLHFGVQIADYSEGLSALLQPSLGSLPSSGAGTYMVLGLSVGALTRSQARRLAGGMWEWQLPH